MLKIGKIYKSLEDFKFSFTKKPFMENDICEYIVVEKNTILTILDIKYNSTIYKYEVMTMVNGKLAYLVFDTKSPLSINTQYYFEETC